MAKLVWFNGVVSPLESATIPVADHAHLYGDGIFEGIRIYNRRVFKLSEHLQRLYHGMTYLGFKHPMDIETLKATVLEVCKQANLDSGYIRLNVTRGTGLGLDPKYIDNNVNLMIMVNTLSLFPQELYKRGLAGVTSPIKVFSSDSLDPRLKCIGRYASNILAKHLANAIGADEAIMLNQDGFVAEGTGENIFLVAGNTLRTPHSSCGILQGITRNTVIKIAAEMEFQVSEENLTTFDLFTADEVFLTGTAAEIISLISLDQRTIGNGKPGLVTEKITQRFKAETENGTAF